MPTGKPRSEGRRRLFRAIATRISHHREDRKEEEGETTNIATQSPYNDSTNINVNTSTGVLPANSIDQALFQDDGSRQSMIASKIPSAPVTQGSDQSQYSYLESMKRAPIKKKQVTGNRSEVITPTSNIKTKHSNGNINNINNNNNNNNNNNSNSNINYKSRGVLSNSTNTVTNNINTNNACGAHSTCFNTSSNNNNNNNRNIPDSLNMDNYSSLTETSANTDVSFMSKSDNFIINNQSKGDYINEYDYKTFSTQHPLRFSKVKAFEQAEMTAKMHFSKYDMNSSTDNGNGRMKWAVSEAVDSDIIIQIPGMSREETNIMLGHNSSESRISDRNINYNATYNASSNVEERLRLMKKGLKPITKEEMILNKLDQSKLKDVFQNSGEFLKEMDLQELELWELMSEEFEEELSLQRVQYKRDEMREGQLVDDADVSHFVQSVNRNRRLRERVSIPEDGWFTKQVCQSVKDCFQLEEDFKLENKSGRK